MSKKTLPKKGQEDQENQGQKNLKYNLDLPHNHEENKAPLKKARDLFFQNYSANLICKTTGVPPSVLYIKQKKSWAKIKDKVDEKFLTQLRAKILSKEAGDILKKGTHIINLYFDRVISRATELDNKDVKLTSDILANLHRMKQLEEGKPTDISLVDKMTPEEAVNYLRELQKEQINKHEMSMFAENSVSEEDLLNEYNKDNDREIH